MNIREIAKAIDKLAQDFDPYGYDDSVYEFEKDPVDYVVEDLENGCAGVIDFLKSIAEDDDPIFTEQAAQLVRAIENLGLVK